MFDGGMKTDRVTALRNRLSGLRSADAAVILIIGGTIFIIYGKTVFYGGDIWDDQSYLSVFRNGSMPDVLFRLLGTPVVELRSPLALFTFWLDAALFGAGNAIAAAPPFLSVFFTTTV